MYQVQAAGLGILLTLPIVLLIIQNRGEQPDVYSTTLFTAIVGVVVILGMSCLLPILIGLRLSEIQHPIIFQIFSLIKGEWLDVDIPTFALIIYVIAG